MRILIADDQFYIRSALALLLEQIAGVEVVGEAADRDELLANTKHTRPDLILLDWELPGLWPGGRPDGSEIAWLVELNETVPDLLLIALSGRPEARVEAAEAGRTEFVSKGDPPEVLMAVVRRMQKPGLKKISNWALLPYNG